MCFTRLVSKTFSFLQNEYGFTKEELNNSQVIFTKSEICILFWYTELQEISMSFGLCKNLIFGRDTLVKKSEPNSEMAFKDLFAFSESEISNALLRDAEILKKYGNRLLSGDIKFIHECQLYFREIKNEMIDDQIRKQVNEAFGKKNYNEALILLKSIKGSLTNLDKKRIEYCNKKK